MKIYWILFSAFCLSITSCNTGSDRADAYGNFESETIYLSAETSGKLIFLNAEEGDQLKAGQHVATIDTSQLHLQKKQLEAKVRALRNKLQNVPVQLGALTEQQRILEREINRTKDLLEDSAATQKQLDDLTGELVVVKSKLNATKSQLSDQNQAIWSEMEALEWQIRQSEDLIQKSILKVSSAGTVLESFKEPEELIMTGQPLLKLANLDQMTLRGFVSGAQLGQIKIGQEVKVYADAPDGELKSYPAQVTWIASEAEFTPKVIQTKEERVNLVYAVKFQVKNDGYIKIGMPGEVRFQ